MDERGDHVPLVTTADLVDGAAHTRSAVAAFNVITLEYAEGVVRGVEAVRRPAILQISQNAVAFHDGAVAPLARAVIELATAAPVPLALHLDHVDDLTLLHQAAAAGFSSVMFDASRLPYADNLAATREAADWAHANGLWLEAELGEVGGKKGAHSPGSRTDPDEAQAFVAATGVDALAVAVGSTHAMLERTAQLDRALIERLRAALDVPLVLHGSSGVPEHELRRAVDAGMVKINIGTALSAAFTGAVRAQLAADPAVADPRGYLDAARRAIADTAGGLAAALGPELRR